jgi:triacylglycerol lipase
MTTICAGRCLLSHISSTPEQVYTYGSPRVGNKRYINHAKTDYLRWVNNNDIVTRVPPAWLGYRHTGQEMYLDANGHIKTLNPLQRGKDRSLGFFKGLQAGEFDYFSDHMIDRYVDYIYQQAKAAGEI